jgi:hypothetical protein
VGAVVGVERCTGDANLGDEGDEGKEPLSFEPRVGAVVSVERCNLGMQNSATRVTKAESHHRWGRACGSGGGCREMQIGDANLGDKGNEGKEPSSLEPRVGAVVMKADLGDEGDEGNEPSPLGPCHSRAERPRQQAASAEKICQDSVHSLWELATWLQAARPGRTARAIAAGSPADKKTGGPRLPPAATACSPPPSCTTTTAQRAVHFLLSFFVCLLFALPPPLLGHYWRSCTAGHGGEAKGYAGARRARSDWLRAGAFGCTAVAAIPSTAGVAFAPAAS